MKQNEFSELINRFYKFDKFKIYFLFVLSFLSGIFEFIGLALIFQFVLFLLNPNSIYSQKILFIFNNYFNIYDFSKISLMLGLGITFVYISKNLFMIFFTKYNNKILEDLSLKITMKILKNFLYQNFLTVNSIPKEEKLSLLNKITVVIWQYCLKYIHFYTNIIIAIILISFLFYKFTTLAIFASLFIGFLAFIEYKFLKNKSNYQNKNFSKTFNQINSINLKIINNIKEIKLDSKEDFFLSEAYKTYKNFNMLNKEKSFNSVLHVYFTEISIMLTFAAILMVLFFSSNFDNKIIITSISTICVIILRLTPTINRAQSALYLINSTKKQAEELIQFDKKFENQIEIIKPEKFAFKDSIKLNNICFSYNKENGLKNINIEIKKGDFIGIVGKSGCYKTTLSLIIAGLLTPISGELLIDNKILNKNEIKSYQNIISLISQDFNLIFDDIYQNFNLNFNEKEKSKIQKLLNKLDLNSIPDKSNALSKGQNQRIALLSELYKNKEILILDEITSSIDVINEEKINEILKEIKGKKTIISIAHRLQILKHCTKILYMDKGEVIDFDTFENLNKKYETFKKIIELSNFKLS